MRNIDIESVGVRPLTAVTFIIGGIWLYSALGYLREINFNRKQKWDFSKNYHSTMRWGYLTGADALGSKMGPKARLLFGYPFSLSVSGILLVYVCGELFNRIGK